MIQPWLCSLVFGSLLLGYPLPAAPADPPAGPYAETRNGLLPTADGFRGLWYSIGRQDDQYRFKYSGGLATYPQQHHPLAVYREQVNKTFFVYGGRYKDKNQLLHMVSFYDHDTGKVARPRVLLDKKTGDAHDQPTLSIDEEGHLYIFSNAHGKSRPSYIHRSEEPYSIKRFHKLDFEVADSNDFYSYSQPWRLPEHGFVFTHTRYGGGRKLAVMNSKDGRHWSHPKLLANMNEGSYQVSWPTPDRESIGTAFNFHPAEHEGPGPGLDYRTNLYYAVSHDGGETWRNAQGGKLDLPVRQPDNAALAVEYRSKNRLVYLKDVQYDAQGRPVILYMTSAGHESGPKNDPRWFMTARWTGDTWQTRRVMQGDNNYDFGSLYVRPDGSWRIIAATEPSPQPYNTGGEVSLWQSENQGETWTKKRQLTDDSPLNHNYPRRPLNYHKDFAALWADGHGRHQSKVRLYFTGIDGEQVYRLPADIPEGVEMVKPQPAP